MSLRIFYHPHYSALTLPERHRFPLAKYQALFERLVSLDYPLAQAAPANREQIEKVHDTAYVQAALAGTLDEGAIRRLGFPWSPLLIERTLHSVGATLAASRHALAQGCGLQISGGYHHAHRGFGSGFCLFNDLDRGANLPGRGTLRAGTDRGSRCPSGRWQRRPVHGQP